MTHPETDRMIETLVNWKFPGEFPEDFASLMEPQWWSATTKKQMEAYRTELRLMSFADMLIIYEQYCEYERNRILEDEAEEFFESPDAKADLEHWSKAAYWTLNEAVALTLGKEPGNVTQEAVEKYYGVSPLAKTYRKTLELAHRAKEIKELPEPLPPTTFLEWAETYMISPPSELVEAVKKHVDRNTGRTTKLASMKPEESVLEQSSYWNELARRAEQAVTDYPKWSKTQTGIKKAGNLHEWLLKDIGANTREAEIIKKIMTDIFQEL